MMKIANKLAIAAALTAVSGLANAAIVNYTITGGNWLSVTQWNNNANGAVSTEVFDNGETPTCLGCDPDFPAEDWVGALGQPGPMNGTYGGTLQIDTLTNKVVGGSLVVTGSIADNITFGGATRWTREFVNLNIDFATNVATGTARCYETTNAPIGCFAVVNPGTITAQFGPRAGVANQDRAATVTFYEAATFVFDGPNTGILQVFRDGRRVGVTGDPADVLHNFRLQVVPVPAAAWLFGSALGLLGVARRKLAA